MLHWHGTTDLDTRDSIRVLLIEDSAVLAERLRELLQQMPRVQLVGVADSERAAVALVGNTPADAMILDLHLREGNGFGVIRAMRLLGRTPEVVVLTNYTLPQYEKQARALGVHYFLDKARQFNAIADVLQEIAAHREAPRPD